MRSWIKALLLAAAGCDTLTTEAPADGDLFDAPVPGLSAAELAAFARGDADFGRGFSVNTGLGPIFNDVSCAACHSGDGRGALGNILTRFSLNGLPAPELGGPQLQDRAIAGAVAEQLPGGVQVSRRLPPPVFGVGLIEAIPDSAILAHADPEDANGDGISGRPNWVEPPDWVPSSEPGAGPGVRLGRFSRKAQVTSLVQQTAEAYHQDIGITTDFLPVENVNPRARAASLAADRVSDPELGAATVLSVVNYLRMLASPAPGGDTPARQRGRALFESIGCASCHRPTYRTGLSAIPAVSNQQVTLYSDLLLHDMGDELADGRPDGVATGREWRTAPLWGLRLMREFLNGQALLLHDGRARSLEDAIGYHGGEAAASRAAFRALSTDDRAALLDFVGSR